MSTGTAFIDRLEEELLRAIGRRRRKRTVVTRLVTMTAVAAALAGALLLTGRGSSPALAVDVAGPLSEGSETVVFVVSSPVPSYWRLTALDDFNGTVWRSRNSYREARGPLSPGVEPGVDGERVTLTFEIRGLTGSWLPAAFSPVRVEGPDGIGFDAQSSSLVTSSRASDGLTYTVEAVLPHYDVATLRAVGAPPAGDHLARYLALPDDFPSELADLARAITAGESTPYDQAIALQNWFRTFTYEFPPSSPGKPTIEEFLARRRGYCEQFAGTYAAFARVLGLPSRVAVGFTPGERGDDGRYYVEGKHAHAWPEVYFEGVGWVPFEPTPGRGNASAAPYTGVAAAQADGGGREVALGDS
jgi:transglutaminase-like putative cysteine protease